MSFFRESPSIAQAIPLGSCEGLDRVWHEVDGSKQLRESLIMWAP